MGAALVIARKDLRQRFRDRSALVLGFIAPLVIAALMSFAFRGADEFHANVVVADADGGPVAAAFTELLRSPDLAGPLTVSAVESAAEARQAVDSGAADAAFRDPGRLLGVRPRWGPGAGDRLRQRRP